jgi:hypothetical protein
MRVHLKISGATQRQIRDRVFREEREHVVKKGNAGLDRGTSLTVNSEIDRHTRLFRDALDCRLSDIHGAEFLADLRTKNKAQSGGRLSCAKSLPGLKRFGCKARPLNERLLAGINHESVGRFCGRDRVGKPARFSVSSQEGQL